MITTEILTKPHDADPTLSKDDVNMVISQAKYDPVKWIVAGVVANGLVATILKYVG